MGGVWTRERLDLRGTRQLVRIAGVGGRAPILFLLHGGPGFPNGVEFLSAHCSLLSVFTIVAWDQRGAGGSYFGSGHQRLTAQGLVEDAACLVRLVRVRFPGAPVIVLGMSWGSELGVLLASSHPDLIDGYIGSGQAVAGRDNEVRSWRWTIEQAQEAGAGWDALRLRLVGPPRRAQYRPRLLGLALQRRILGRYVRRSLAENGREGSPRQPVSAPPELSSVIRRDVAERIGLRCGVVRSLRQLWPTATSYDFRLDVPILPVPVVLLQGRHDHTTPSSLVEEYLRVLRAPLVRVVWFEHSGHSPAYDEPRTFEEEIGKAVASILEARPPREKEEQ